MAYPTLLDTALRFTDAIYYGDVTSSSVPASRTLEGLQGVLIDGVGGTPVDLSADRTIGLDLDGGGTNPVGSGRLINTTAPLTGGGTLNVDLTLEIDEFAGNGVPGYVPDPGVLVDPETFFLDAEGNWNDNVAGIPPSRTLTMGEGLEIDGGASADLSADRLIEAIQFTTVSQGVVPASTGAITDFLRADGVWADPFGGTTGPFIRLQGSYPGTPDTGNGNISGTFGAATALVVGSDEKSLNGTGNETLYVKQATTTTRPTVALYATTAGSGLLFRTAMGTEASPTPLTSGKSIVRQGVSVLTSGSIYTETDFLTVAASANANANRQPFNTTLAASGGSGGSPTAGFVFVGGDTGNVGINQATPLSDLDISGSFGLTHVGKTANFTADGDSCLYECDASLGTITATLPAANTCARRVYGFIKTDETAFRPVTISGTISGTTGWQLGTLGDSLIIRSDGTGWWVIASHIFADQTGQAANGTPIANDDTEQLLVGFNSWGPILPGAVYRTQTLCTFGTIGTPTLDLVVRNAADAPIADFGTITMPNNASGCALHIEADFFVRAVALGVLTTRILKAIVHISDNNGLVTTRSGVHSFGDLSGAPSSITAEWGTASASNTITAVESVLAKTPKTFLV